MKIGSIGNVDEWESCIAEALNAREKPARRIGSMQWQTQAFLI
jgi:hypothetical protein